MDLRIRDIVEMLQVNEKTVYRWIKDKKIPCYRINHQYRFNRTEINEWILSNKIETSDKVLELTLANRPTSFSDLLDNGGIHYDIEGETVQDVLGHAIAAIHTPDTLAKEEVVAALVDREEMMPTAIGNGVALPHPRNPIIADVEDAGVSICFLKRPVDFGALDGQPVHVLFIILTYSPRRHLEVLSKISFLCRDPAFQALLEERASEGTIKAYVKAKELAWSRKERQLR